MLRRARALSGISLPGRACCRPTSVVVHQRPGPSLSPAEPTIRVFFSEPFAPTPLRMHGQLHCLYRRSIAIASYCGHGCSHSATRERDMAECDTWACSLATHTKGRACRRPATVHMLDMLDVPATCVFVGGVSLQPSSWQHVGSISYASGHAVGNRFLLHECSSWLQARHVSCRCFAMCPIMHGICRRAYCLFLCLRTDS